MICEKEDKITLQVLLINMSVHYYYYIDRGMGESGII